MGAAAQPVQKFLGCKYFDLERATVFCLDYTSQSAKWKDILEIWEAMPSLATPTYACLPTAFCDAEW